MIKFSIRAKIYILIIINLISIFLKSYSVEIALILSIAIFYLIEKKVKFVFKGLKVYLLLFLLVYLLGKINSILIGFTVFTLIAVKKVFPILFFASAMMKTSRFGEVIFALSTFRLPKYLIIMFSIIFRFFPSFYLEMKNNRNAFKLRSYKKGKFNTYFSQFLYFSIIPLMRRAELVSEELSQVAILRGMESDKARTSMFESTVSFYDFIAVFVFFSILIYEVVYT